VKSFTLTKWMLLVPTRTRTRAFPYACGSREQYFNLALLAHDDYSFNLTEEHCVDTADSPGVDHNFALLRKNAYTESITGRVPGGPFANSGYQDYYPDWLNQTSFIDINDLPVTSQDFATLKSRTNPSRPVVNPLTLIQDLVDIPRQLKDVGKLLRSPRKALNPREIANQNLAAQFGWLPLIDDAQKLLHLQDHIAKRVKEVHRLDSKSGLKRRIKLDSNTLVDELPNVPMATDFLAGNIYAHFKRRQDTTKWGTIRWKPTSLPPYGSQDIERISQIRRVAQGLTVEGLFQGAWDLIPWTWVTDWFVDVGSYITSTSNTIPADASHVNVMQHITCYTDVTKGSSSSSHIPPFNGKLIAESKARSANTAPFAVRIPFIGLRRLSILGSLFAQRFK
jgi:hypothetical protein